MPDAYWHDREGKPMTATEWLWESDYSIIAELLMALLEDSGMTQAQIDKELEKRAREYLADQTEQWWEI